MAQTERSSTDALALLANNAAGAISPQDARDVYASTCGYGGMLLSIAGHPVTMSSVGTSDEIITVFDLATAQSVDVNTGGVTVDAVTNNRITVGTTGMYRIEFWASFSSSANKKLHHFTPYKNGVIGLVEVERFIDTGSDTGSMSMSAIIPYTAADYVDVRIRIDSGTSDVTFEAAGFNIFRVG